MSGAGALTVEDLDDLRIAGIKPLIPSACLIEDLRPSQKGRLCSKVCVANLGFARSDVL